MLGAAFAGRFRQLAEDCCAVVIRKKPTRQDAICLCQYPRTTRHNISMAPLGAGISQAGEPV
jgi:hypothetical protein